MAILVYDALTVTYDGVPVVSDVTLEVEEGETHCVVGESGSGKSTLARAALRLLGPGGAVAKGAIRYRGHDVTKLDPRALRGGALALIFQDSLAALSPQRRVGSQLVAALRRHLRQPRDELVGALSDRLRAMGIADPERVLRAYPHELSGGMGQRVAIAQALLLKAGVVFADEPTSALDAVSQAQVIAELEAAREAGTTLVLITHDMSLARRMADTVTVMRAGTVVEQGSARDVLACPASAYTRDLIAATPHFVG